MRNDKGLMPAIILTLLCLTAISLLAFTNQITLATRQQQALQAENKNREMLFPEAAAFFEIDLTDAAESHPAVTQAYQVEDENGDNIGWLVAARMRGYGGYVPIMAALEPGGTLRGLRVLANEETPGLGKKIEEPVFLNQFNGKSAQVIFTTKLDEPGRESIDSVSGATISSRAVAEALNAINRLYPILEKEAA